MIELLLLVGGFLLWLVLLVVWVAVVAYRFGYNDGDTEGSQRQYEECDEAS